MNKRQIIAAALFLLGFLLIVGTYGKYELNGHIQASEFLKKTVVGLLLMAASLPVSGEMDELFGQQYEKRKNRR